jgi:hypothetical protein
MLRLAGAFGFCCVLLTGCVDPQTRAIVAEANERARDLDVNVIGQITDVGNGGVMQVDGVGLVTGLQGTGGTPNNEYRKLMEQYLLKQIGNKGGEIPHEARQRRVREILDDPNNAVVIVTGYIPPGSHKGNRFDVNIKFPHGSKATSLAGGYLQLCMLRTYESPGNLSNDPKYQNSSQLLPGHIFAHAEGPLVVGFGGNADANELTHARVWQGGKSHIDRPYIFMTKKDVRTIHVANDVAQRMNFMYQEDAKARARSLDFSEGEKRILLTGLATQQLNSNRDSYGMGPGDIAKASKEGGIFVRVPAIYRLDHQRFIDVASRTPLRDVDPELPRYRKRLEKMLLDPRDTREAALRLEALGRDIIPLLKTGLESDHPFVRFCSAESLAYLGSTAGVDVLARLAQQHPVLAKNCTMALAGLGETICRERLADMLVSEQPALRVAAFHALTLVKEDDPRLQGIYLNDKFWLHQISHAPTQMVYFSTGKRPQIVLFGKNIRIEPGTLVMVPKDFTVTYDNAKKTFFVKRITSQGTEQRQSSGNLGEILSNLAYLGATYPEVVDFLRRVQEFHYVNCPVVAWSTPDVPLETLLEAGRAMKQGQ